MKYFSVLIAEEESVGWAVNSFPQTAFAHGVISDQLISTNSPQIASWRAKTFTTNPRSKLKVKDREVSVQKIYSSANWSWIKVSKGR